MKKEFRSNLGYLIGIGVFVWVLFGFLLTMCAVAGASLYTSLTNMEAGTGYYAASISTAILTAVMPALILSVYGCCVTVSVGTEEVLFKCGGRVRKRFPLKGNVFSSNIHSTYYYGVIKISTVRMLSVITNGVRKEYRCSAFTKDTFDQMIAAVHEASMYANTPGISRVAAAMSKESIPVRTYTVPRENIIRVMSRKRLMLNLIGLLLCSAGVLVSFALAAAAGGTHSAAFGFGFILLTLFFVSLGFFLYHLVLYTNFRKHTPSAVTVDSNSIQIDGKVFERGAVEYIKATAPEYAKSAYIPIRRIILAGRFGRCEYWFGGDNVVSKSCVVYAEYPELYRELGNFLLRDGRLLVNDL